MPVIKRYPNRKLYNTETKQYITLNEIADLIRAGQDIQVLDHESGQDLTTLILSQIVLEQEKKHSGFLPRSILSELVRAGGSRMSKLQHALASTLDWWGEFDRELRRRFNALVERGELSAEEATQLLDKLSRQPQKQNETLTETIEKRLATLLEERGLPTRQELEALSRQLEALNRQIEALNKSGEETQDSPEEQA
ncbi:MAG: pesticidal protein Cry15Aa [Anaerolineae bacterium]|nr:MAG: pesticidal protein Cry15Aa [Anaerolineae bacterium]